MRACEAAWAREGGVASTLVARLARSPPPAWFRRLHFYILFTRVLSNLLKRTRGAFQLSGTSPPVAMHFHKEGIDIT